PRHRPHCEGYACTRPVPSNRACEPAPRKLLRRLARHTAQEARHRSGRPRLDGARPGADTVRHRSLHSPPSRPLLVSAIYIVLLRISEFYSGISPGEHRISLGCMWDDEGSATQKLLGMPEGDGLGSSRYASSASFK